MVLTQCHQKSVVTVTASVNHNDTSNERLGLSTTLSTVPAWAQDWINEKAAEGIAPSSLHRYAYDLEVLGLDLSKSTVPEIRAKLAECSLTHSRGTLRHICIALKQVLRQLGRESEAKQIKLPKHGDSRIVIYSETDIQTLINSCKNLRDRLLVEILAETGARRGELYNMCIGDVQFDQYSAIICLRGKTGTRTRRVYNSIPDIIKYLIQHPERENEEAKFWVNDDGQPIGYQGIYKIIRRMGYRSLGRGIYPHGFRHSAATRDVKSYTDREMMIRYGWNRPEMVAVYAHLTGRDVDEKDLALHGFMVKRVAQK